MQTTPNATNPSAAGGNVLAGLFEDSAQGERALADLKKAGFSRAEISGVGLEKNGAASVPEPARPQPSMSTAPSSAMADTKFFSEHDSSASSFADELTKLGFSTNDAHDLVDGITKGGGAMVTVAAGANASNAMDILKRYKADVRTARSGTTPAAAPAMRNEKDEREMQLRAERLQVDKQRIQHGEARVRKEVITETQSIDVPVSHEELVIERRAVTGGQAASGTIGQSEEIRIPLSEERVNVSKSTVVTEQVEIGKRNVAGVEHVSDTVRHEELLVDGQETRKK